MTPAAQILASYTQRCLYRQLAELIERCEAAADDLIPAAAQYVSNWDPEDMERRYCAEQLAILQSDLHRLRQLLEELGINPREAGP